MAEITITGTTRTEFGKGASRRDRRAGQVPAVIYGHGEAPKHVALPLRELGAALKTSNVLLDVVSYYCRST
jgi:large subunit ribosomal protein L25